MDKIVFATNNPHKLAEISTMLQGKFEIISLDELGCTEEIPETADTLEGNASLKSQYIYDKYKCNCFADDTGLEIEALNKEPGVYSARYASEAKDALENMKKVLHKMRGVTNRKAKFRTVISLILEGQEILFEGNVEGEITQDISGKEGFGYDPIFQPDGYNVTFAQLSRSEKNEISHRGRAVQKLIQFLKHHTS